MKHKLINSKWERTMIILSIFLMLNTVVFGVPLSMSYSNQENIKNEHFTQEKERDDKKLDDSNCIVNGSKYGDGENVTGAGPCEECICRPPNVVCSMMKCPINSGCITIQLPNKCCPTYKCDCEHKGKLYNNGEKIIKYDNSSCRVCFCNGGEIVCTNIVCYTRNDCQGYYLPGECCPKFDNCSSISTPIEHKSKESIDLKKSSVSNIYHWSLSTEQSYNEDNVWKRDTSKSLKQESSTVPIIITMPSKLLNPKKVSRQMNMSLSNNGFGELNASTLSSMLEKNITYNDSTNEVNTPDNLVTDTTIDDFNITEDSKTSFLGFEIDNLTINEDTTDSSSIINNETSLITPEFEELFDTTTDIDNSVVFIHHNGTETIVGITDLPYTEEMINSSTETTTNIEVEIFNPSDLISNTKRSMIELSTVTSELDETTELDYEESREATTPRAVDKPTIATPHKLVINSLPTTIEEEINTEIKFTDLEDTTDMFGPNFGHRSYETQTHRISIKSDKPNSGLKEINYATTLLPNILTSSENIRKMTTESSQNVLFDQPLTNSNIKSIENNTSLNIEYNFENIPVETTEMYNDTNFLEIEIKNITACINNSCFDYSKLNDELWNSQIETTSTTPFIIETKLLPNQASLPFVNKKLLYPKEYPDEFETIQNGPALTITKRTYTSIPDIVYTTTTMITLPTLDLIYKADKEIEKYLSEIQSTTIKPKNNNLSPLRNISSLKST